MKPFELNQFIVFGDSLTQRGYELHTGGWVSLLSNIYIRKRDIINRGFSGYTTKYCLELIQPILQHAINSKSKVDLISILLGTNDSVLPGYKQYVPVENTIKNLKEIVSIIRKMLPETRILLIIPPPIYDEYYNQDNIPKGTERTQKALNVYRNSIKQLCNEININYIDIWKTIFGTDKDEDYDAKKANDILIDGVHFNEKGNLILYNEIIKAIKLNWPELNPDPMDLHPPYWRLILENEDDLSKY